MGDERVGLSRRRLLKLGAVGVALASTETMFPQLAAKAAQGAAQPLTVRSSSLGWKMLFNNPNVWSFNNH